MKKKIVIIGALGYLGTELSRLYSGESHYHDIVGIDNRFISERVNQLRNWNIRFFQGQILDKSFLEIHLKKADIVHHLAGITDVAYIKNESNRELDDKIKAFKHYTTEIKKFPHPRSIESIKNLATHRGIESGLKKAEAFTLIRSIND